MGSVPTLADPFADRTFMHPAVLAATLALCLVVLLSNRRMAIAGLLLAVNFITGSQRLYLLGVNLPVLRILILVSIVRIVLRRECSAIRVLTLDRVLGFYALASVVSYTLQLPSAASLNYALGNALDALGAYFAVRCLVRGVDDLRGVVRTLGWISIAMAILFALEAIGGRNPFDFMGGIPESVDVRAGRSRLQGPYPHPILAGAYWGALVPLFLASAPKGGREATFLYVAAGAATVVVVLCASSTPLVSLAVGLAAMLLFRYRRSLSSVKLAVLFGLVVLGLGMRHPIWFLVARIDVVGGSTGYYRYLLVDSFIRHWSDWFLIGIRDTISWGRNLSLPWVGLRDLTNQFVYEGVRGGVASLAAFVAAVAVSFGYVGHAVRRARDESVARLHWGVGVSLLVHVFSFFAVSYFGQVRFAWWMTLALCANGFAGAEVRRPDRSLESRAALAGGART